MNEKEVRERIVELEGAICFCTTQINRRKTTGDIKYWVDRRNIAVREIESLTDILVKGAKAQ